MASIEESLTVYDQYDHNKIVLRSTPSQLRYFQLTASFHLFTNSTGNARENLSTVSGRNSHAMFMFRIQLKQCYTSTFSETTNRFSEI